MLADEIVLSIRTETNEMVIAFEVDEVGKNRRSDIGAKRGCIGFHGPQFVVIIITNNKNLEIYKR